MMKTLRWQIVFGIMLACTGLSAHAVTCTVSAQNINFGNYSGAVIDVSATITVNCTSGANYSLGINAGLGSGATTTHRLMTNAGNTFGYQLFQDAAHSINWGNNPPTDTVSGVGTGSNQTVTVYGQVPAGEYSANGGYNDTVTVFLTGATTANHSFNLNGNVSATCALSATSLNFGTYAKTLINGTSTISVQCTNSTTYNIGLNAGTATGATVTTRKMTGPSANVLSYALYSNSGMTTNWGNTVGTNTVAGTGTGLVQTLTVYGQLAASQSVNPGSYTDTITATITY